MQIVHRIHDWLYRSRRKLATAGVGLLACLMAVHIVFGANGLFAYYKKRAEYRTLGREIQELQRENERVSGQIKSLKSDPATIEREAREKLRYARPGEVVYTLPEEEQPKDRSAAAQSR